MDVLAKYNIPEHGILFAYRVNYEVVATDDDLTLVILSVYSDGCQEQWINAVKEIRAGLVQHNLYWRIELVDRRVFYGPLRTFPVLSTDHNLIQGWRKVLPDFLNIIKDQSWVSIDVLYRDFPSRERQPTIIVSARDANDDSWNITLPAIKQLLQDHRLEVDVVLLYLEGLLMMTTSKPADLTAQNSEPDSVTNSVPDLHIAESFYRNTLQMGTSCSASGSTSSGTLGGGIKLQGKGNTILELGLTNYHVMKDAFQDQKPMAGPFPPVLASEKPYGTAAIPSYNDHMKTSRALNDALPLKKKNYEDLAQQLEGFVATDDARKRMQKKSQMNTALLEYQAIESRIKDANLDSRSLGRIYAASGFQTCENPRYDGEVCKDWALDWCLIQINQPGLISNQLEKVSLTASHVVENTAVTQYCSINGNQNYDVIKRGRTSGWTKGVISGIESVVRLEDPKIKPEIPTSQQAQFKDKWIGRHVFVHSIIGTTKVPKFIKPGDSGSFVLLDQANAPTAPIVGLGFAGNDVTCASYLIPMDLVIKDIETLTDMKVIEPVYLSEADGCIPEKKREPSE